MVTPSTTLLEAAETGVLAENLNIAVYDELLTMVVKYPSLVQVFTEARFPGAAGGHDSSVW